MSYDGMYSELSTRGTSSQILTLVLEARDEVLLAESNVEALEASTVNNAGLAQGSADIATGAASDADSAAATAVAAQSAALVSANAAAQSAIDAETNSEAALIIANNASAVANSANNLANQADIKADEALATANGIAGTANTALANSNAAVSTANAAEATANGIEAIAISAQEDASEALSTANGAAAAVASKQDGDPMLTALAGLTTSNDKSLYFQGVDNPVLYDLTDLGRNIVGSANAPTVRTLLGIVDSATSLIEGLDFYRSAAGTIKVGVGRAYIPSLSTVLLVPSELTLTLTGLSAGTLYHIYLFSNVGTPTLEFATTAPVLYQAPSSYQKTGDNSRRYIGSFIAISTTDCYKFVQTGNHVLYMENTVSGLLSIAGGVRGTVSTNLSLSGVVPVTTTAAQLALGNSIDTAAVVRLANPDMGAVSSTNLLQTLDQGGLGNWMSVLFPLSSTQQLNYIFDSAGTTGGLVVRVQGYSFRR